MKKLIAAMAAAGAVFMLGTLHAQTDPGPRSPIATAIVNAPRLPLTDSVDMQKFWGGGQKIFEQSFSVSGNNVTNNISGEPGVGLGPGFNGNSCAMCHFQPTAGGSSPITNQQVAVANLDGASNSLSFLPFITAGGPTREARFLSNPDGTPDGGVHDLFTIAGRSDAPGCNLAQPDFASELADDNVIFRIPTPLFGLGLVENTSDATLEANLAAEQSAGSALGISGKFNIQFNTSGNDATITKFGWKAQNKSLAIFTGEAMNVELGVTNENFPNERNAVSGCVFNTTPEDFTPATGPNGTPPTTGTATQMASVMENLVAFMRFNAPPVPVPGGFTTQNGTVVAASSIANGQALFASTGCALCHTPSLTTAGSHFEDLSNQTFNPYSDFALHQMGSGLADGVSQGAAGPADFRTAPLWGVGQRLFFLHDGRTSDLLVAINAHASNSNGKKNGSEANAVINNFNNLSVSNQQDILNFLRSL
jgi:CxxC motif-containing protein (DUF1111 family)